MIGPSVPCINGAEVAMKKWILGLGITFGTTKLGLPGAGAAIGGGVAGASGGI